MQELKSISIASE
jgi:hypothetical protein